MYTHIYACVCMYVCMYVRAYSLCFVFGEAHNLDQPCHPHTAYLRRGFCGSASMPLQVTETVIREASALCGIRLKKTDTHEFCFVCGLTNATSQPEHLVIFRDA